MKIKLPNKKYWISSGLCLAVFVLAFGIGGYYIKAVKPYWLDFFNQVGIIKGQPKNIILPPAEVAPYNPQTTQEEAVMNVVKNVSPSVVSVLISKGKGTERQIIGSGSGFIVSPDGMILTNKHVVSEPFAFYQVVTWEGKKYSAVVLAKDPLQDLAIMKITTSTKQGENINLPAVKFGNSDSAVVGQTAIAIGNALGEFSNSVSVGVISGLSRSITASGGGISEDLDDIFQTDAAINKGNSGGPLLNLKGEVIGVNVAVAEGAQSIGFAIPFNKARRDIRQFQEQGKISYPFLGVRYILVDVDIQAEKKLSVDYGAWITKGDTASESAIEKGSSAAKAGLRENDIILQADGVKITKKVRLSNIIQNQHIPGDKVVLKVLRNTKELDITVTLGEKSSG